MGQNGIYTYTVNGRTYGVHENGTLFPMSGNGFVDLTRGAFRVVGIYNQYGPPDPNNRRHPTNQQLDNQPWITPEDRTAGVDAWQAGGSVGRSALR